MSNFWLTPIADLAIISRRAEVMNEQGFFIDLRTRCKIGSIFLLTDGKITQEKTIFQGR